MHKHFSDMYFLNLMTTNLWHISDIIGTTSSIKHIINHPAAWPSTRFIKRHRLLVHFIVLYFVTEAESYWKPSTSNAVDAYFRWMSNLSPSYFLIFIDSINHFLAKWLTLFDPLGFASSFKKSIEVCACGIDPAYYSFKIYYSNLFLMVY